MDVVNMRRCSSNGITINEPGPLHMTVAGRHQQSVSVDLVSGKGKRKLDDIPMSTGCSTANGHFSEGLRHNEGVIATEIDVPNTSYSTITSRKRRPHLLQQQRLQYVRRLLP